MNFQNKVVALIGVGPLVGQQIATAYAKAGFKVALMSRLLAANQELAQLLVGNGHSAFYCNVLKPESIRQAFAALRSHYQIDEPDVVVYNVRDWHFDNFDHVSASDMTNCFNLASLGLFHVAKQVLPGMKSRGHGVLGVTGATANWRGLPSTVAFAPAKAAQRALAQSLAREFGPKGIHVYLVVVDGVISEEGGRHVSPAAIAATHVQLSEQPSAAWTFELNLTAGPGYDKLVTI